MPSPWWKSGYFEVRYENSAQNKPYFYDNEGEGLRTELIQFVRCVSWMTASVKISVAQWIYLKNQWKNLIDGKI